MQRSKLTGLILLMLVLTQTVQAQWHTKWYEVTGEATIVLANTKDVHDDINVSAKKKLVMDATLDALQNAINLRLNPVISTQAYKSILEQDYLTINDHLIDLLAQQDIVWQRQQSPVFTRDADNPSKWTVKITGLVKKANTETPPVIVQSGKPQAVQPQVIDPTVPVTTQPTAVLAKKKKKKRNFTRYFLSLQAGATYDLPTYLDLDNGDYIDVNDGLGYKFGVRLPLGRNFVIGGDYHMQEVELGQEFGYGGPGGFGSHRWGGHGHRRGHYGGDYDSFEATHTVSMTGFGVNMGTYRNFINPSIGAFYQRGEVMDLGTDSFSGEILTRGATLGLDFGKGRIKLGLEATAFWMNTNANLDGFGSVEQPTELLSELRWEEVNWRFGVNLKLFL